MKEILGAEENSSFDIRSCDSDRCEIMENSSGMYVQVAIFSIVALILRERLVKC